MTTHSSIWLLNKLCSRKSYSFTSTGMVIAWISSSSCPTKSIKQLYGQRNIPQWKCSQLEDEWEVPPSYLHHLLFFPSLLVQIQRYKVEELDGWLDWHTSASQQSLCHRKKTDPVLDDDDHIGVGIPECAIARSGRYTSSITFRCVKFDGTYNCPCERLTKNR